jgi:hypothetical protein
MDISIFGHKNLVVPVIFRNEFFTKMDLVLHVWNFRHHFHFAPDVYSTWSSLQTSNFALQMMTQLTDCAFHLDHLLPGYHRHLSEIIKLHFHALSSKLEYHIQLHRPKT